MSSWSRGFPGMFYERKINFSLVWASSLFLQLILALCNIPSQPCLLQAVQPFQARAVTLLSTPPTLHPVHCTNPSVSGSISTLAYYVPQKWKLMVYFCILAFSKIPCTQSHPPEMWVLGLKSEGGFPSRSQRLQITAPYFNSSDTLCLYLHVPCFSPCSIADKFSLLKNCH